MEKSASFMGGEEFSFYNCVLQLHVVDFERKGVDDLLSAVHFLCQYCTHRILLGGIGVNAKLFVGIRVGAEDGIGDGRLNLCEGCGLLLPLDEGYILFGECGNGLKNLGTVGNVILDEIDHAKEAPNFWML